MRKILVSIAITAMSFGAATMPSPAGVMPDAATIRQASAVELATHYYGHKPKCFWKKIKKYDY